MKKRYRPQINHQSEFELDLAPLLAVMVKLVPVLLVSSAFAQLMIVETELPQIVKAALERQETDSKTPVVSLIFDKKTGVQIIVAQGSQQQNEVVPLTEKKDFNYDAIHLKMLEIKKKYPEVFKVQFEPASNVTYKEIVRLMDEVRKSRDTNIRFPVVDTKTGIQNTTDYMFPEVLFGQLTEG